MKQLLTHEAWLNRLRADALQKQFRVLSPNSVGSDIYEVDISLIPNQTGSGDSSAEQTGFTVDVRYSAAPDMVIFTGTYPTEDTAKKVFDDLSTAAATVEGLIRETDMEGAQEQMKAFTALCSSSSAEPPIPDTNKTGV